MISLPGLSLTFETSNRFFYWLFKYRGIQPGLRQRAENLGSTLIRRFLGNGQQNMKGRTWAFDFIVTIGFNPNGSTMRLDNAFRDRQT